MCTTLAKMKGKFAAVRARQSNYLEVSRGEKKSRVPRVPTYSALNNQNNNKKKKRETVLAVWNV